MATDPIDQIRAALPINIVIDGFLDSGGQGAVFRGMADGKPSAIKVFDPNSDPRRLDRELDVLQSIACPYLVSIITHCRVMIDGLTYPLVAYDFHVCGDLRRHVSPSSPQLDVAEIIRLGSHIGLALESLWARRIVHRDVKPGNIVQAADGRYVLVDVGLARHLDRSNITVPGGAPGTQGYKSPEQQRGRQNLTISSDVFSLGVTLYEIATQQHPFRRMQHLIGQSTPRPISEFRSDLPRPLARLIHQMMTTVPSSRPRSVARLFESMTTE